MTPEYTFRIRLRLKPGRPWPSDIERGWEPQNTLFTGTLVDIEHELRWMPVIDHPDLERVIVDAADYPLPEAVRALAKEFGIHVVEEE